jgi:hypothetical protein
MRKAVVMDSIKCYWTFGVRKQSMCENLVPCAAHGVREDVMEVLQSTSRRSAVEVLDCSGYCERRVPNRCWRCHHSPR